MGHGGGVGGINHLPANQTVGSRMPELHRWAGVGGANVQAGEVEAQVRIERPGGQDARQRRDVAVEDEVPVHRHRLPHGGDLAQGEPICSV